MPATGTKTSRERVAITAIPVLLIAVALLQIGRAAILDQSSYAGFGFGMFATYENELSRWTELSAVDDEGRPIPVVADPDLDLAVQEVPTSTNIEALAEWALASDPSLRSVHAAVWTVAVRDRPMRVERVLLVDALVERPR